MKQSQHTRAVLAETLPGRRAVVMGQCLAAQPRGDGPGASEDAVPASARGVCPAVRDTGISRVAQDLRTPSPMQTILHDAANADNIESREPRAESREPRAESREPRAESREPRAESREPRAESREPRAESREPRAESREPRAESREPRAESREPRAESREPRAESREPRAESREFIPPAAVHHAPAERSSYHPPGCTMSASRTTGPVRPPEPSPRPRGASSRQDRPAPPPPDAGASPSPRPCFPRRIGPAPVLPPAPAPPA